jgi:formamidopyrimidine-DNA glycosylase
MPEGPEVYSFGIEALDYFKNNKLIKINILSGKYKKKSVKNFNILKTVLPSKILSVSTYGKILLLQLELNYFVVVTFGMTGFLTTSDMKHNRIEFVTESGISIYYNDQRNFGNIYVLPSDVLNEKISVLGPDLLDNRTSFEIFKKQFDKFLEKSPTMKIGLLLIDQTFVCGIGNYLRADILYYSKISPYRELKKIKTIELKTIYNKTYNLIRYYASIQMPTKLRTKKIKDNLVYSLNHTPQDYGRVFMIYGEKNDVDGNKISKDKFYGRSIYWVNDVQN